MRRLDSLFGRLMLLQGLLLACMLVFLWLIVVVERNVRMAPYHAQNWAPHIRRVLAAPDAVPLPEQNGPYAIRRTRVRPPHLWFDIGWMPATASVQAELGRLGLHVGDTYLDWRDGRVVLWAQVADGAAPAQWIGASGIEALPAVTTRLPLELLLLLAVNSLLSLYFARRITGPIELLRRHMHGRAQAGLALGGSPPPALPANAATEVREMHADYSRLIEQLQRQERERVILLAGVSHDLRSPLGRIRLAAEMLPELADNRDGVAAITRNVDHADRLIGSFVDYVRAGQLPLDQAVDLPAVLRAAIERLARPPGQLRLLAPPQLVLQRANALLIDRLVFNLVDNAFKHGLPPVVVTLRSQAQGASAAGGNNILIEVHDQGAGLPAAGGAGLLDAFARGDSARQVPGLGLGLTVVQHIVERLQGTLLAWRDDSGHTIRITLANAKPDAH